MVKRITQAKELRAILEKMENGDFLKNICSKQKHVVGDWNLNHLKEQLCQLHLVFNDKAVIFVNFENDVPTSIFAGLVSEDWACGKTGLNEIIWVSSTRSFAGGIKVLQEVEKYIVEKGVDFLSCSYMCNGGDPRVQMFYANNGFRLDTLNFVKSYK